MKRNLWLLVSILGLLGVAAGAYFWATGMITTLMDYRSPLAQNPPAAGEPLGAPITRRVVVVLMDALREDTARNPQVMPFLNQLRQQGASATMHSRPPSFSAPGWATLLTGAWPDINDAQLLNPPDETHVRPFTQDSLFDAAQRTGLRTAVSGYGWFEGMLANDGVDAGFYTPGEDNAADLEVVTATLPWLTQDYQLILIHIDQIDYAGHHQGGPRSPNWNAAATRADNMLGEIVAQLDLNQDTVLVLSDHGQIDQGGHGGNEPVTMVEPFVAVGAGIQPGQYPDILMVDVAPTLASLLGVNIPASNQGRPLAEMLTLAPDQVAAIQAQVEAQQSQLFSAYTKAIRSTAVVAQSGETVSATQLAMEQARAARLAGERVWRIALAILLLVLPAWLIIVRRSKKTLWMAGGALLYFLLFNLRYAILDGNTYGLSSIPGQMEFILYVAATAAIALGIAWLVTILGLRAFRSGPRAAAGSTLSLVWFVLYLLAFPILLSFALNGLLPTWTLPEFTTQFLGFFAVAQCLFVAALGLLLVGISALIGKFAAKRT